MWTCLAPDLEDHPKFVKGRVTRYQTSQAFRETKANTAKPKCH